MCSNSVHPRIVADYPFYPISSNESSWLKLESLHVVSFLFQETWRHFGSTLPRCTSWTPSCRAARLTRTSSTTTNCNRERKWPRGKNWKRHLSQTLSQKPSECSNRDTSSVNKRYRLCTTEGWNDLNKNVSLTFYF